MWIYFRKHARKLCLRKVALGKHARTLFTKNIFVSADRCFIYFRTHALRWTSESKALIKSSRDTHLLMLQHEDAVFIFAKIKTVLIVRLHLGIEVYRIQFFLGASAIPISNHNPNRNALRLEYYFSYFSLFH